MIIIKKGIQSGRDEQGNKYEKEIDLQLESTMIYMANLLGSLHEALEMALEMDDKDLMSKALTNLSWIHGDLLWHNDGEPGNDGETYWDAGIGRMEHHGLMTEAIELEKEANEKYEEWEKTKTPQYRD